MSNDATTPPTPDHSNPHHSNPDHSKNVLVRTWRKLWLDADAAGIDELINDPYVRHSCDGDVTMRPSDYANHITSITSHLRGTEVEVASLAEVDDMIYARFTLRGMNLTTGTPVRVAWMGQYRVVDGKLAESWTLRQSDAAW